MSTLLTQEVTASKLSQNFLMHADVTLYAIQCWIYASNAIATLVAELYQDIDLLASSTFEASSLPEADHHHGVAKFDFDIRLERNTEYILKLSSSSVQEYYWCKDWEKDHDRLYGDYSTSNSDAIKPYLFKLYVRNL